MKKNIKKNIILKYKKNPKDCGSIEIQIALLSYKIKLLKKHFIINKRDYHGKYGLLKIISKRRKFLNYIKKKNFKKYLYLLKSLSLRK